MVMSRTAAQGGGAEMGVRVWMCARAGGRKQLRMTVGAGDDRGMDDEGGEGLVRTGAGEESNDGSDERGGGNGGGAVRVDADELGSRS